MKKSPHTQGSKPVSPAAPIIISTLTGGDAASLAAMDVHQRCVCAPCNKQFSTGSLLAG